MRRKPAPRRATPTTMGRLIRALLNERFGTVRELERERMILPPRAPRREAA